MQLLSKYTECKLKPDDDSDLWVATMENFRRRLENDYGERITDEEFVTRLLQNIPDEGFQMLKMNFIRKLTSDLDPLTLESLKEQLQLYKTITKSESSIPKIEDSLVGQMDRYRRPMCKKCGKEGHDSESFW